MDRVFSQIRKVTESDTDTDTITTTTAAAPKPEKNDQTPPSNSELFSSAKLVADACKSSVSGESEKIDKPKVAEAAGDILDAAESHGKLQEKGYGKYVDQAEEYLHKYGDSTTAAPPTTTTETPPKKEEEKEKFGSGGYGEYTKMAEGLFKK